MLTSFCAPSTPGCGLPWLSCESASSTFMPVRFKRSSALAIWSMPSRAASFQACPSAAGSPVKPARTPYFRSNDTSPWADAAPPANANAAAAARRRTDFSERMCFPPPGRANRASAFEPCGFNGDGRLSRLTASLEAARGSCPFRAFSQPSIKVGDDGRSAPLRHRRRAVLDLAMRQHPILPDPMSATSLHEGQFGATPPRTTR